MQPVEFTGTVVATDGSTVFESVSGYYLIEQSGALKKWRGELEVNSDELPHLFVGIIRFDDGNEGEAFGTRLGRNGEKIGFEGGGPIVPSA